MPPRIDEAGTSNHFYKSQSMIDRDTAAASFLNCSGNQSLRGRRKSEGSVSELQEMQLPNVLLNVRGTGSSVPPPIGILNAKKRAVMTTTDQFAGTLLDVAELSELCRIERMEDQFLVFYDSRTLIEVEFKQVSQTAMLMMNVGPLPLENRLLVIETLLEFNFIRCATGSISMAVDSVHDQVVQQQQLSTCDLSTPRLKQALDRFKRLGMQWNTLLQSDLAELADPPTDQEQTDAHLSKFMTV